MIPRLESSKSLEEWIYSYEDEMRVSHLTREFEFMLPQDQRQPKPNQKLIIQLTERKLLLLEIEVLSVERIEKILNIPQTWRDVCQVLFRMIDEGEVKNEGFWSKSAYR